MRWYERLSALWWRVTGWEFLGEWVRVIPNRETNEPYLIRYYLLSTRWLEPIFDALPVLRMLFGWMSFRLCLHNTLQSDQHGLHDHPWPWASYILEGGYWEATPHGRFWRAPGELRFRSASSFHRLELDPLKSHRKGVWSLFLMGPRQKEWGFLDRTGVWVPWGEYLRNLEKYYYPPKAA